MEDTLMYVAIIWRGVCCFELPTAMKKLARPNCASEGDEPLSCQETVEFWPAANVVPVTGDVRKTFASAEATRASETMIVENILSQRTSGTK